MRCIAFRVWPMVLLLVATVACAQDPKPKASKKAAAPKDEPKLTKAQEEYKALVKDYQTERNEFQKALSEAKTDEEKAKVREEKQPNVKEFADKFLEIADQHPSDPGAVDCLIWVTNFARGTDQANKSMDLLLSEHLDDPRAIRMMGNLTRMPDGEKKLKKIIKENASNKDVQGAATYFLGELYFDKAENGDESAGAQAEKLFDEFIEKFSKEKMSSAFVSKAKGNLKEIRTLGVGKEAPEIEAEDIEGEKFKLSEYRGKVVLLDFWGDW